MPKSKADGGKGRSVVFVILLLCSLVTRAIRIYGLKEEIMGYQAAVSDFQEELDSLNTEIDELLHPRDGVLYNGRLSLHGNRLVNEHGEAVQLRGVSSHGIMWYPEYGNYRAIATTKERGANVFRAAMYTTENGGYDENPTQASRTLKTIVENALGADMYVIVDWHVLKEENPNVFVEEAVRFFDEISRLYADEPGVIYEICNEPNGDTSWEDIKAYAEQVVPVIRGNCPNALILVGTPNYCVDLRAAADDPLPYDNIMYTYHYYAVYDQGGYESSILYALEKGCAVFVSEWGVGGSVDITGQNGTWDKAGAFLDFLDRNNISWVSWALSNKNESHSLIAPESARLSYWPEDGLTEYGKFVFNRLNRGGEE